MDAGAYIASAVMFRRALQVITRKILNITPSSLASELKSAVGLTHNGVIITQDFGEIGYIIKEAANQAAHPDQDPDLLDFTEQDAKDLQNIFMELVSDLFVTPAVVRKAKADFINRRKLKP